MSDIFLRLWEPRYWAGREITLLGLALQRASECAKCNHVFIQVCGFRDLCPVARCKVKH